VEGERLAAVGDAPLQEKTMPLGKPGGAFCFGCYYEKGIVGGRIDDRIGFGKGKHMRTFFRAVSFALPRLILATLALITTARVSAQISPGPYEYFPFEDGFIVEAFKDLQTNTPGIADWTGYSGATWISPNAYDNHTGTDCSVQTGTPLYATAAGTVSAIETIYARDDHSGGGLGNFVRIAVDELSPNGDPINVVYGHLLSVAVTKGQRVAVGDQVGLSDNTGNSTSEHVHFQSEIRASTSPTCPFYWGHFKYPIVFNVTGTFQVGRVVKITAVSTPIRTNRFDSSLQISTAYKDQLYFASFAKRGYYQVFIPNNTSWRSGWVRVTDVEEVMAGTVIQPLPDDVSFTALVQLQTNYTIRTAADDGASSLGQIWFGGQRFIADQITNGYYRIPVPGASATWGWVKADSRMIVYPALTNPALNLSALPSKEFPLKDSFKTTGKSSFGRPKFNRSIVKGHTLGASPGGDTNALFVTDQTNHGNGTSESVTVGKPSHTNYFVQCDLYFNYHASYLVNGAWERTGIFVRDDGFAGLDTTFEGAGNGYALLWDNHDGRMRAARLTDGAVTDLFPAVKTYPISGWHTLRIEVRTNQLKFLYDGQVLLQTTDTNFFAGQMGLGYTWHPGSPSVYPAARGAYFDNFVADTLDPVPLTVRNASIQADGKLHFQINGTVGSTSAIERATDLASTNWLFVTNMTNTNSVIEFTDSTNAASGFYRARTAP
jgi:hypothetical protein